MLVADSERPLPTLSAPPVPAIAARGVHKAYDGRPALAGVDLTVARGELVALLGPNGAGKTTLVEILEGHRRADAGAVAVLGHDPARRERAFRGRIGIVLQSDGIDPTAEVGEAVALYGAAYPDPRPASEALELVGLADRADRRVASLSGGQRRRLDLALGIVGRAEVLFLDEPTTGFDPHARRDAWELVRRLRADGTTILLTTHYLDEAEALADRVVVLAGGRVLADGPPGGLGGRPEARVAFTLPPGAGDAPLPAGPTGVDGGRLAFASSRPAPDLAPVLAWAAARDLELPDLSVTRPDLEDVYLELTQEAAR